MILAERVALVTGGGQGVGRGVALALAAEGAQVAVVGRTLATCESVADEILARGGTAAAFRCDVTRAADVAACVTAARARFGPVQVLVNSAQTSHFSSLRRLTEQAFEEQWRSGPLGTLLLMQACFDDLRATGGSVINFGSGSSLSAQPAMGGYAAAKEAIRVLSRVAATEWGRYGIRVNVMLPLAESPGMTQWAGELADAGAVLADTVPLGRIGDPERDIGRAAVFLAGPDAGYITGTTLMVDGGHDYLR